jgi:hypothetical protein
VDITYDGHTFFAAYVQGGRIEQGTTALKSRTIVQCDWSNPFAWQYTSYGVEEPIHYTRYKGHGADVQAIFMGDVVDVVFKQSDRKGKRWAEIAIDPLTAVMRRSGLVRRYSRQCDAVVYDEVCGVARETFKVQGTLDSVTGNLLTSTTFATQADGWWAGGDIVVNGQRRVILAHSTDTIRIWPAASGLAAGQTFDVYPGCDHLTATCDGKFSNLANYPGQPNIPDTNPMDYGVVTS